MHMDAEDCGGHVLGDSVLSPPASNERVDHNPYIQVTVKFSYATFTWVSNVLSR